MGLQVPSRTSLVDAWPGQNSRSPPIERDRHTSGDYITTYGTNCLHVKLPTRSLQLMYVSVQKPAQRYIYGERCLKVGKAGPRSVARYCSQHYGMNARSTLAKSLLANQSRIGVSGLDERNVGEWIRQNTHRFNFLLPSAYGIFAMTLLEAFVQCRLKPEFEGFESQRSATQSML